jgi:SAM-dependent methyltransferase
MANTPAIVVVLTAPNPTRRMPNFPLASVIFSEFFTTGNYIIGHGFKLVLSMFWLKKAAPAEPLAVSMAGVKLGDRLLVIGCTDGSLIADLAVKTGLTGRACAVDEDAGRTARAASTAEREGALIESFTGLWTELRFESAAFDLVVVRDVLGSLDMHRRLAALAEILRVMRPGGRCIVMEGGGRGGLRALFSRQPANAEYTSSGGAVGAMTSAGFLGVRTLAERGGMTFVEGVKSAA